MERPFCEVLCTVCGDCCRAATAALHFSPAAFPTCPSCTIHWSKIEPTQCTVLAFCTCAAPDVYCSAGSSRLPAQWPSQGQTSSTVTPQHALCPATRSPPCLLCHSQCSPAHYIPACPTSKRARTTTAPQRSGQRQRPAAQPSPGSHAPPGWPGQPAARH